MAGMLRAGTHGRALKAAFATPLSCSNLLRAADPCSSNVAGLPTSAGLPLHCLSSLPFSAHHSTQRRRISSGTTNGIQWYNSSSSNLFRRSAMHDSWSFVTLGTSSSIPTPFRNVSASLLTTPKYSYLFDCGEGTHARLRDCYIASFRNLRRVFITHLHGDHVYGLPSLLCTLSQSLRVEEGEIGGGNGGSSGIGADFQGFQGFHAGEGGAAAPSPSSSSSSSTSSAQAAFQGAERVAIYGPTGLYSIVCAALQTMPPKLRSALPFDFYELLSKGDARPAGPVASQQGGTFVGQLHLLRPRGDGSFLLHEDSEHRVVAAPLQHSVRCFGFVLQEKDRVHLDAAAAAARGIPTGPLLAKLKQGEDVRAPNGTVVKASDVLVAGAPGRKIVVLGDNAGADAIVPFALGADLVLHEATVTDTEDERKARSRGHSTARMAGSFAKAVGAKKLLLTHFPGSYASWAAESSVHEMGLDLAEAALKQIYQGKLQLQYQGQQQGQEQLLHSGSTAAGAAGMAAASRDHSRGGSASAGGSYEGRARSSSPFGRHSSSSSSRERSGGKHPQTEAAGGRSFTTLAAAEGSSEVFVEDPSSSSSSSSSPSPSLFQQPPQQWERSPVKRAVRAFASSVHALQGSVRARYAALTAGIFETQRMLPDGTLASSAGGSPLAAAAAAAGGAAKKGKHNNWQAAAGGAGGADAPSDVKFAFQQTTVQQNAENLVAEAASAAAGSPGGTGAASALVFLRDYSFPEVKETPMMSQLCQAAAEELGHGSVLTARDFMAIVLPRPAPKPTAVTGSGSASRAAALPTSTPAAGAATGGTAAAGGRTALPGKAASAARSESGKGAQPLKESVKDAMRSKGQSSSPAQIPPKRFERT